MDDKEKLRRLRDFGIFVDDVTNVIHLEMEIYTEGGKNAEVHRAVLPLKRKIAELEKQLSTRKGRGVNVG